MRLLEEIEISSLENEHLISKNKNLPDFNKKELPNIQKIKSELINNKKFFYHIHNNIINNPLISSLRVNLTLTVNKALVQNSMSKV